MKEAFQDQNFSISSMAIIRQAEKICNDYSRAGYKLTLRQLYYQFVSRQPLPEPWANSEKNYKRLGNIISDARLAGLIDWSMIEDRGRCIEENPHWDSPADILDACAKQYRIDTWEDQPCFLMVMVEKQALEGVLEPVCRKLDIPFAANKGYSSSSALYSLGKRLGRMRPAKDVHVLYLGDHDPSGIDMTRDVEERLCQFARSNIFVHRLALNMDQVEQYGPPENPAKLTDSRAKGYVEQFGESSWELDALEPTVLASLVDDFAAQYIDAEAMADSLRRQQNGRDGILEAANKFRKEQDDL